MELTPWAFLFNSFPTQTPALKPIPLRCSNLTLRSFRAGCVSVGCFHCPFGKLRDPFLSSGADASCSERHLCTQHYKEERSPWAFLYSLQLHHITHKQKTNKPIPLRWVGSPYPYYYKKKKAGGAKSTCLQDVLKSMV